MVLTNPFTVGEVEYESRISGNTEHLPIVVSLLGSPGKSPPTLAPYAAQ